MASETSTGRPTPLDLGSDHADAFGMPRSDERPPDLVALCNENSAMEQLRAGFAEFDLPVDLARSLDELRGLFFARGGHDLLILTADLSTSIAERAVRAMRELDPTIAVVAFGHDLARANLPGTVTRVPEFHPCSRAGVGAVVKVLRSRNP